MSSPWKTGLKCQAFEVLPEIDGLAQDVLKLEKYEEANRITEFLVGKSKEKRLYAQSKLILEVGLKPTRPLLYLMPLFRSLPRCTRDCIRYLGDYIDLLTKEMSFEYVKGRSRQNSLGKNAALILKSAVPPEIHEVAKTLARYNQFLYCPGKHDFSLPKGRKHRFTVKEVVLTTYVTAFIAEKIKELSELARIAVEKDNLYIIGGRWGSKSRVEYAGERY